MRLKHIFEKLNSANDGTRTLFESIAIPEVEAALRDWIRAGGQGVLIGGCAVGYYGRPRSTTDVDLLFLSKADIPDDITGFKRTRPGAFQHKSTHVEVEVVSATQINVAEDLVREVIKTAIASDGIRVASPTGLVALKLQRMKANDIGDIVTLVKTGKVDLTGWPLDQKALDNFDEINRRFVD